MSEYQKIKNFQKIKNLTPSKLMKLKLKSEVYENLDFQILSQYLLKIIERYIESYTYLASDLKIHRELTAYDLLGFVDFYLLNEYYASIINKELNEEVEEEVEEEKEEDEYQKIKNLIPHELIKLDLKSKEFENLDFKILSQYLLKKIKEYAESYNRLASDLVYYRSLTVNKLSKIANFDLFTESYISKLNEDLEEEIRDGRI